MLTTHRHIIGYSVPYKAEAVRPRENVHDMELENDCLPTCVIHAHTHTYVIHMEQKRIISLVLEESHDLREYRDF